METSKQKVQQEIEQAVRSRNEILSIVGAFGDIENCEGYIKEVVQPPEGGLMVGFFGCSYLFKGWPDNKIVEGIGLAKAMLSVFPRVILAKSIELKLVLLYFFLLRKRKLIHYLHVYSTMIYGHVVVKVGFEEKKYNLFVRELKRAFDVQIKKLDTKILTRDREKLACDGLSTNYDEFDIVGKFEDRKLVRAISQVAEFVWLFIEHDNAYRFPLQDVLVLIDKTNLVDNPRKEILRVFDILIERADVEHGIKDKAIQIRKLISLFLFFIKEGRYFARDFLLAIDLEKIKLDDNDWYFCLKRRGFNFRGMELIERLAIKKQLDDERNHYRLQLMDIKMAGQSPTKGFKVVKFDDMNDIPSNNITKDQQDSTFIT